MQCCTHVRMYVCTYVCMYVCCAPGFSRPNYFQSLELFSIFVAFICISHLLLHYTTFISSSF